MVLPLLIGMSGIIVGGCFFLIYYQNKFRLLKATKQLDSNKLQLENVKQNEQLLSQELEKLQLEFKKMREDSVTHLLSWHLFEDRLQQNIKESSRYQLTMGLLFIDIDNFTRINDALGHKRGDILLKSTAERLTNCIRQVDSVARFNKDTFAVLLVKLAKPETAAIVAQRIIQAFKEPFLIASEELFTTISIGIAIYPADGQQTSELQRSAEYALRSAKESGRGNYKFYQEKLHTQSIRELTLLTNLSHEMAYKAFSILYQPIVNAQNESIFCMEVVLRWEHPQLGTIPVDEIFYYAERQHKLNEIIEWLIEEACQQFLQWQSLGFSPNYISVPLSIKQLENSQFIYRLAQILKNLSFKPDWLLIELQESVEHFSVESLEKSFNMLDYMGIKIVVDGFGSAYSFSLLHLKNIPICYLKLHPKMVEEIHMNEKALVLVESVLYLANKMSIKVIAHGVESLEQMQLLKKIGCEFVQGLLLGAPRPKQEITNKEM